MGAVRLCLHGKALCPPFYSPFSDGTMIGQVSHHDHDQLESVIRDQIEKAELVH
jgi:hypothetical protein